MMKIIPSIKLPIIKNGDSSNHILSDITKNKKIIIFGVPGAFTPTCSEKHLPGFINLYNQSLSLTKKIIKAAMISVGLL